MDEERHRVEWPVDFSRYQVTPREHTRPLDLLDRRPYPEQFEWLRAYLSRCDLDVLVYYTCDTNRYLQNCQDRMDWFFYLDYFIDSVCTTRREREEAVADMLTWLEARDFRSRIDWVHGINQMLGDTLEPLERDGLDTSALLYDTRTYIEALAREDDRSLSLEGYLDNRANTNGVKCEIEFCFAYLGRPVPVEQRGRAYTMKQLTTHIITLYNDLCSQYKESLLEQQHVNLKSFFPDARKYLSFALGTYTELFTAFHALRPSSPGPLADYWQTCKQWLCGGLLWHLTNRRYNLGQIELHL